MPAREQPHLARTGFQRFPRIVDRRGSDTDDNDALAA